MTVSTELTPAGSRDADGPLSDLTGFQRDALTVIADRDGPHGLAIKSDLEAVYGEMINHGRLYPNLDALVTAGLVTKSEVDGRTNAYTLTDAGHDALVADLKWRAEAADAGGL